MTDASVTENRTPGRFLTTRWSIVRDCACIEGKTAVAQEALGQLCQIYWRPIFAFICRRGYSVADAQDLTQDFFLSVLQGTLLHRADPNRGRFRTYLLHALQNFLNDMKDKRRTRKRGGGVQFISWDDWMAEAPSRLSIPEHTLETWPPERLFDLRWAATVVERALRGLAEECESQGRRRVFDVLSSVLSAERADVSIADLARRLGVAEGLTKRLLHELRERYRRLLREEVAHTVETPASIDDELRYLCAALAAGAEK